MEEKYKEIIMRQSRTITIMFVVILLLIVALFLSHCEKTKQLVGVEDKLPMGCGTVMQPGVDASAAYDLLKRNGDIRKGEKLFKQNCAVCHTINDKKITGPGLKGVFDRVPAPAEEWIRNFILNSEKVIKSGDPYANKIFHENGKQTMTVFEDALNEQEVNEILFYVAAANGSREAVP